MPPTGKNSGSLAFGGLDWTGCREFERTANLDRELPLRTTMVLKVEDDGMAGDGKKRSEKIKAETKGYPTELQDENTNQANERPD